MKEYEAEIEKQRILRHETKNQLLTIKSKIVDKNDEKQTIEYNWNHSRMYSGFVHDTVYKGESNASWYKI